MNIREACERDLDAIAELIAQCNAVDPCVFGRSKESIRAEIGSYRVIEADGVFAGSGRFKIMKTVADASEINAFCIVERFRRKGFGSALLQRIVAEARTPRIYLETRPPTVPFFEHSGFRVIGSLADIFRGVIASEFRPELDSYSLDCARFPDQCPGVLLEYVPSR